MFLILQILFRPPLYFINTLENTRSNGLVQLNSKQRFNLENPHWEIPRDSPIERSLQNATKMFSQFALQWVSVASKGSSERAGLHGSSRESS